MEGLGIKRQRLEDQNKALGPIHMQPQFHNPNLQTSGRQNIFGQSNQQQQQFNNPFLNISARLQSQHMPQSSNTLHEQSQQQFSHHKHLQSSQVIQMQNQGLNVQNRFSSEEQHQLPSTEPNAFQYHIHHTQNH